MVSLVLLVVLASLVVVGAWLLLRRSHSHLEQSNPVKSDRRGRFRRDDPTVGSAQGGTGFASGMFSDGVSSGGDGADGGGGDGGG